MDDLREFIDGDYTAPQPCGPRRVLTPFQDAPSALLVEQDYMMLARYFGPAHVAPLDQALPAGLRPRDDTFWLVEQTDPVPTDPGFVRFTRRWANLPPNRLEPETYVLSPDRTGDDIAEVEASTEFVWSSTLTPSVLDVLNMAPPGATSVRVEPVRWDGGNTIWKLSYTLRINRTKSAQQGVWVNEPANLIAQTILSWARIRYFHTPDPSTIEIIQADASTTTGNTGGNVLEPSALTRWKGNIWERRTRYKTAA